MVRTEKGSRVKVQGLTTAVSAIPVRQGKTHPFSGLDHAMGQHHLRLVFYYQSDASDPGFPLELEKLKESLSETLSHYPPATGRLRRGEEGNWEAKYSDAGVRVLEAKVGVGLEEWMKSATCSDERDLTYWADMPEDPYIWSPYYIQINEFEGGGVAIGMSCTHIHADPTCATLLVKAWADVHRRSAIVNPPFFHPPGLRGRPNPNTATKSAKFYDAKSKSPVPPPEKMLTATYRFSDASVKKLLSEIHPACLDATPFDALAALFWRSACRAKSPASHQTRSISICTDFRKLMHAPLPHGYYGNALHFSGLSVSGEEMDGAGGLGRVAGFIRTHLSGLNEEEYWSAIDWIESQKDASGRFPAPFRMYGPELTVTNMEHVFAYGAMMEKEAKPLHVGYQVGGVEGEGLIMVLPSPEEGIGRTVTVTLPREEMSRLHEEEDILRFRPTMLFSDEC